MEEAEEAEELKEEYTHKWWKGEAAFSKAREKKKKKKKTSHVWEKSAMRD